MAPVNSPPSQQQANQEPTSSHQSRSSPGPQVSQGPEPQFPPGPQSDPPESTNQPPKNPRLAALQAKQSTLSQTLADLEAERATLISKYGSSSGLTLPQSDSEQANTAAALQAAKARIQQHIKLLHQYNEIKDIGQALIGMVAEQRGVRVKDVMGEFGVEEGD